MFLISNRWLDHVRHGPLTKHPRIYNEQTDPSLVSYPDRSMRPFRNRSLGGFVIRSPDQLHNGFEVKTLPNRGDPASAGVHRFAPRTGRPSIRQDIVSDLRGLAFRTEWPPHRTDTRRLSGLRCILPPYDRQPDADTTRGRYRAEGTAAGTRLQLGKDVG